jgi:hypothetical protein
MPGTPRNRVVLRILPLSLGILLSLPAPAVCVSDCKHEYASAIDDCKVMYDDPDDSDDLEMCLP